ncbi:TMEM175 family protein [Streptomyces sp. NPDC101225]|uniref:TMEM175 family protein n=1 Tax=Streptomyces sp. NPDC101225 TaxID=3366135 RepID=UPI0038197C47
MNKLIHVPADRGPEHSGLPCRHSGSAYSAGCNSCAAGDKGTQLLAKLRPVPEAGVMTESVQEPGESTPFGEERDPARVVAFSDAVIAIAITLLVLEIRPPHDTRHLLHGLAALWPSYLAYGVTFMLIGQVWANHHIMFDHIRSADRVVLFLNTMLLMDVAFLPFAASVLAEAFRDGHGQRTAVVLHGIAFELAAVLFNVIWWYAGHDRRLLTTTIDAAGVTAIGRRFQLALVWIGLGTLLGGLVPILGVAVIAAFIPYYWLPIAGELARAKRRSARRDRT